MGLISIDINRPIDLDLIIIFMLKSAVLAVIIKDGFIAK